MGERRADEKEVDGIDEGVFKKKSLRSNTVETEGRSRDDDDDDDGWMDGGVSAARWRS